MDETKLIVTRLPLTESVPAAKALKARLIGDVDGDRIKQLLRAGAVEFVIADAGLPLEWIALGDRFEFWKSKVQPHLVPQDAKLFSPADFAGHYCYVARQWQGDGDRVIIVLEKHH